MKTMRSCVVGAGLLMLSSVAVASGSLGIAAVIERVVFEPNGDAPERVQVFGAFAYYDGQANEASEFTDPVRGYLYFSLPSSGSSTTARREWADLATMAGTGEPVAFGGYGYIGHFEAIAADLPSNTVDNRNGSADIGYPLGLGMGVQDVGVEPTRPAEYSPSDLGVVRLGEGNYEALVARLRALLDE
jgi:hypothetical protein